MLSAIDDPTSQIKYCIVCLSPSFVCTCMVVSVVLFVILGKLEWEGNGEEKWEWSTENYC